MAGGVGCGVGFTTTTRGKRPVDGEVLAVEVVDPDGGVDGGGGRSTPGTGETTTQVAVAV